MNRIFLVWYFDRGKREITFSVIIPGRGSGEENFENFYRSVRPPKWWTQPSLRQMLCKLPCKIFYCKNQRPFATKIVGKKLTLCHGNCAENRPFAMRFYFLFLWYWMLILSCNLNVNSRLTDWLFKILLIIMKAYLLRVHSILEKKKDKKWVLTTWTIPRA